MHLCIAVIDNQKSVHLRYALLPAGQSVAKYIQNPAPFNTQVVALGVDTYLKMLLTDNFVHT